MKQTEQKNAKLRSMNEISIYLGRMLKLMAIEPGEPKSVPVIQTFYHDVDDYNSDFKNRSEAQLYNEKLKDREKRITKLRFDISAIIERSIPHYVWFKIKILNNYYAIGVSTGTWGGGCQALSVKDLSKHKMKDLPKLEHTTHYA